MSQRIQKSFNSLTPLISFYPFHCLFLSIMLLPCITSFIKHYLDRFKYSIIFFYLLVSFYVLALFILSSTSVDVFYIQLKSFFISCSLGSAGDEFSQISFYENSFSTPLLKDFFPLIQNFRLADMVPSFDTLKTSFHCLLALTVSIQKLNNLYFFPWQKCVILPQTILKTCLLSLGFCSQTMMCLHEVLFMFILLGFSEPLETVESCH